MEQIAIYPYNDAYAPVVRHQNLMHGMRIASLISPKGWGYNGECIKTDDAELIVSDNFAAEIGKCSAVWFVDDAFVPLPKVLLEDKLREALKQNKKILFTRSLKADEEDVKSLIPDAKEIKFEIEDYFWEEHSKTCYNINTPVIFVLGLTENTDKFEVQLALREQLLQKGYNISSVSSRRDSAILGMHPLPSFLFDGGTCETEKILSYNHLIKQIELRESPEIIIIGIPGGAFPFSNNKHNYFGITAYEISNAVTCDCAIFCSPYLDYSVDLDSFPRISNEAYGKFGFSIDYFHIAARTFDYFYEQPHEENFNWVTLDTAFVDAKIKTYDKDNIYNLLQPHEIQWLTEKVIDQLSDAAPKAQSI